jgi:hypothetical protein
MADIKDSQKQERAFSRMVGGSLNSGSGNGWLRKADVRTEKELFELKITDKKSYSLKDAELDKLTDQALIDGRIPVFMVEFKSTGNSWVILSKNDYLMMREEANLGNEVT